MQNLPDFWRDTVQFTDFWGTFTGIVEICAHLMEEGEEPVTLSDGSIIIVYPNGTWDLCTNV